MDTKKCTTCQLELPLSAFSKNRTQKDGYHRECKADVKAYQLTNKEKLKEYQREYQAKYKAEHKEELDQYLKNWQQANPEKTRAHVAASKARNAEHYRTYQREWARKDRLRKQLAKQQQPNDQ